MVVYKVTNLINGKFYIGKDALNDHEYLGSGLLIKMAINKYGRDNFKKEVIEICGDLDELANREAYWIDEFDATNRYIAYNIVSGGFGGDTYTNHPNKKEISRKKSASLKEWHSTREVSIETRQKISIAHKDKIVSDTTRQKQSVAQRKRFREHPITEETRQKLKNRPKTNIKRYTFISPDGENISSEHGVEQFCRDYGLTQPNVHKLIRGTFKQYKGWRYFHMENE